MTGKEYGKEVNSDKTEDKSNQEKFTNPKTTSGRIDSSPLFSGHDSSPKSDIAAVTFRS